MMDVEKLNQALYDKMAAEQKNYRSWLLGQTPEEILNHTYEYTVRQDILIAMEDADLEFSQVEALLSSKSPLSDVYHDFANMETGYMDTLHECMANLADAIISAQQEKERRQARKPSIKAQLAAKPAPGGQSAAKQKDKEAR